MCHVAEIEGGHQLTVCNLWRIERLETGALATWEYALAEGRWKEVVDLSHWPEIPLFPFREATALKWCKLLLRQAVLRVFIAASDGKLALKDFERAAAGDLDRRGRSASVPWVAWQMLAHYFGGRERVVVRADGNPRLERKAGWLNLTLVRRGAAAIQSAL